MGMKIGGRSIDEYRALASRVAQGDQQALAQLRASSGVRVNTGAKVALGAIAAVTTMGVSGAGLALAGDIARKTVPTSPPQGENFMVPQTLSALGGSAGRSATPGIPTGTTGIVPGLVNMGLDYLRNRVSGGGSNALVPNTCPDGSRMVLGRCLDLMPGGNVSGGGMVLDTGEVVRGRYGAAEVPMMRDVTTHRCRKGLVLGDDGLCYRRGHLRKDERKWAPGTKPLLTGGERNALKIAARVGGKMKGAQRQLMSMGLLPRPKSRRQIELELRYGGKMRGR